MENKEISLRQMYFELKNLEKVLQRKGVISQFEISESVGSSPEQVQILADEQLLAKDWLSPEDEEAWKDL